MYWNGGNCIAKRTDINKCCTADLNFVMFFMKWETAETDFYGIAH
jgi:hypothetical protein